MTTTLKLSVPLESKLAAEARARRTTKSHIIRELLERHFKASGKKRRVTFGEAFGHVAGGFSGPSDLSTNPKHMKGYGA